MMNLKQFFACLILCTHICITTMQEDIMSDTWISRAAYVLEQLLCAIDKLPVPIYRDQARNVSSPSKNDASSIYSTRKSNR